MSRRFSRARHPENPRALTDGHGGVRYIASSNQLASFGEDRSNLINKFLVDRVSLNEVALPRAEPACASGENDGIQLGVFHDHNCGLGSTITSVVRVIREDNHADSTVFPLPLHETAGRIS